MISIWVTQFQGHGVSLGIWATTSKNLTRTTVAWVSTLNMWVKLAEKAGETAVMSGGLST